MKSGIISTPQYENHQNYPECPDRVSITTSYFKSHGITEFLEPTLYDETHIRSVHTNSYIQELKSSEVIEGSDFHYTDAYLSACGCLTAGDLLISGEIENGFVLNRPPGHHAYANSGGGFCYLNNAAILAKYLQRRGMNRIMIIDWDAHHGNGTESIFYDDPSVLYSSIHQTPLYPGTGRVDDIGTGDGEGYTVNIPVPPGTGHETYRQIFNEVLIPVGNVFKPDAVIISAGQDSHENDPITDLKLTAASYHLMTTLILKEICTKTIAVLEGGYNLENLPKANYAIATALKGECNPFDIIRVREPNFAERAVMSAQKVVAEYGYL